MNAMSENMSQVAQSKIPATIPVIDIGPFLRREPNASQIVRDIEIACRTIGFFLITGHGVCPKKTKKLYQLARDFFDLPQTVKTATKSDLAPDKNKINGEMTEINGGLHFSPLAEEALAATLGEKTPGDYKESLNFGPRLKGGLWPDKPDGLEAAFKDYFLEMERLAMSLRQIFCNAIGLPEDYFEDDFIHHLSALRVINYPEQDQAPLPGQLRAGAHTDYGFMTILRSEASSGGLQVQARDGSWLDAPQIEGAYVINIGDAFMRWTNDHWISNAHRVANPPQKTNGGQIGSSARNTTSRRQSIAFFLNPGSDTRIQCLEPFLEDGRQAKYEPISFGDYIALKTQQAFKST